MVVGTCYKSFVIVGGSITGTLLNRRLNRQYSLLLSLLPISKLIPSFLNQTSLGLHDYRTQTVLSFLVATDEVARKVLAQIVGFLSEVLPVPALQVQCLAHLDRVTNNLYKSYSSCIFISSPFVTALVCFLWGGDMCSFFFWAIDNLSILTLFSVPSFSIVRVFCLTGRKTNGRDVLCIKLYEGKPSLFWCLSFPKQSRSAYL